jgi:hypothetical protein
MIGKRMWFSNKSFNFSVEKANTGMGNQIRKRMIHQKWCLRNSHHVAIHAGDEEFVKRVAILTLADLEQLTTHVGIGLVVIST